MSLYRTATVKSANLWNVILVAFLVDRVSKHAYLCAHENKYLCSLLPTPASEDGYLASPYYRFP
jgi:hypothetical protein